MYYSEVLGFEDGKEWIILLLITFIKNAHQSFVSVYEHQGVKLKIKLCETNSS